MKTTISIIALSAGTGAVFTQLASSALLAHVPADLVFAVVAGLAVVGIMIADYRRQPRPLPVQVARVIPPTHSTPARNAYRIRLRQSTRRERLVA